ncbi:MAG: hypothetical protein P1U32_00410 [Legionellaceae bacterium]|nr:hypothetical protein [Legionellaceae bacterium]
MVKIKLTNHNPNAAYPCKHVIFDVASKLFQLENEENVTQADLLAQSFSHPLFDEPYTPEPNFQFEYEYVDFEGMLYTATFVCTILLHTTHPESCQFTIKPSLQFETIKCPKTIFFSSNYRKKSQASITLNQLNQLVSTLSGKPFLYSNDLIPCHSFTLKTLPPVIDGDSLYQMPQDILQLFYPKAHDDYELRYINPDVGLGVFSRKAIKQGDCIGVYSGIQSNKRIKRLDYSYKIEKEASNIYIHATEFGNLTRFINHAPKTTKPRFLSANVKSIKYQLCGLTFIAYHTARDILPGEQLLTDYGKTFFRHGKNPTPFKSNGKPPFLQRLKASPHKKMVALRTMANHGVHSAKHYLVKRLFVITMLTYITLKVTKLM